MQLIAIFRVFLNLKVFMNTFTRNPKLNTPSAVRFTYSVVFKSDIILDKYIIGYDAFSVPKASVCPKQQSAQGLSELKA